MMLFFSLHDQGRILLTGTRYKQRTITAECPNHRRMFSPCAVLPPQTKGEGFREIRKHSTVQCKKITNIAWQKHQTIN